MRCGRMMELYLVIISFMLFVWVLLFVPSSRSSSNSEGEE